MRRLDNPFGLWISLFHCIRWHASFFNKLSKKPAEQNQIECGKSMTLLYTNRRIWIFQAFAFAAAALLLTCNPSSAANLKDVRIGEYDDFTRIVFEFDAQVAPQPITFPHPGVLDISFTDTVPSFRRRIPVERSDRISALHIWIKKTGLSASLHFSGALMRHESFTLENPFRIALDVYIQPPEKQFALPPLLGDESAGPLKQAVQNEDQMPLEKKQQSNENQMPLETMPQAEDKPAEQTPAANSGTEPAAATLQTETSESENAVVIESTQDLAGQNAAIQDDKLPHVDRGSHMGLQYYLVISLVIITIIILLLLVLMLLSKYRGAEDRTPIDVEGFLNQQDEQIAALDARIQEQFKRYDSA